MGSTKRSFGLIFAALLIDIAAMSMTLPVFPGIFGRFVDGDLARAAQLVGIVGAIAAGLEFLFAPMIGAISDRVGRKPVLLLGMLGPGLTYLLLAEAPNVGWLVIGYCVSGVIGAIYTTVNAYVADVTPPADRAGRFGLLGAAMGLGFILGPVVGGALGTISLELPLYAAGGLTLVNLVLCVFLLPESLPADRRSAFRWANANPLASLALLRRSPVVLALAASLVLYNLAVNGLYSVWLFVTELRFDWSIAQTGATFALMGFMAALAQGMLVGPAVKRLGERRSILVGLSIGSLSFLAYAFANESWMFYAIIAISSFAALEVPASQSLITASVSETEQGAAQGAFASAISLTRIVGPLLATNVFATFVAPDAPVYFPGAPLALGAVMIAAGALIVLKFVRPVETVEERPTAIEPVAVGAR